MLKILLSSNFTKPHFKFRKQKNPLYAGYIPSSANMTSPTSTEFSETATAIYSRNFALISKKQRVKMIVVSAAVLITIIILIAITVATLFAMGVFDKKQGKLINTT